MSRLAGLINKEKNRRIVSAMFSSSDAPVSLACTETLTENPLSEHLVTLERVIFEDGVRIDKARTDVLISELEAIANTLA